MSDVLKLAVDGSNWITCRDRMHIALAMKQLTPCIMNDTIPQAHTAVGVINNLQPNDRREIDQVITRHFIVSAIPDSIFFG